MKNLALSLLALGLLASASQAQQSPAVPKSEVSAADKLRVDEVVQRYLSSYQHKNLQELVTVWPDLQNQKKEYDKIKHHFADSRLSDEQMEVAVTDIQPTNDGFVVHAQRTEKFVRSESSSTLVGGDLLGGSPQSQAAPINNPVVGIKKKDFKKSDEVWITMHRAGDQWTIVSITNTNPIPAVKPLA
jgi:hypothetical protein